MHTVVALQYVALLWHVQFMFRKLLHFVLNGKISDLLAVWRHISEDTEQEVALLPGVKGCGNDDVTALF